MGPITTAGATLEQQALEVGEALTNAQNSDVDNPNGLNMVTTHTYNDSTGILNISLAIPVTSARNVTTGVIELTATPVFGV